MNSEESIFTKKYWIPRGSSKLLTYIGPPLGSTPDHAKLKKMLEEMGALGAMWNYDKDYSQTGPWYRCICDSEGYDESKIESKNARHNLRRSLKRCVFKEVDYQWLADNAYSVYVNAASRFTNFKIDSEAEFKAGLLKYAGDSDRKAFAVFVDESPVAFMTLFVAGKTAFGDTAFFDPAHSSAYPMYALYYCVAQHFLGSGYKEFDRGSRPLLHETNVDEFLLRLGFRYSYCRLGLYLARPVRIMLGLAKLGKKLYPRFLPKRLAAILDGLLLAQTIAFETGTTP